MNLTHRIQEVVLICLEGILFHAHKKWMKSFFIEQEIHTLNTFDVIHLRDMYNVCLIETYK